ncbi:MAG: glycine cleavage system protein T [Gammaproteobacteria bacterium]|nr:glycine cleavage system protein T [Gammaproteobacteria bacterium]
MVMTEELPLSTTLPFQARIRKSPFFNAVRRHGCHSFGVYNRTYISMGFHDPETEYHDLLSNVVLWPVAGERQIEIKGPQALAFVQLLTPRDLSRCQVGQCKYVLITADDGGIVNDPVCLRIAQDTFWLSAADSDLLLYARGVNALAKMDVQIRDADVCALQIQGPNSLSFMRSLAGDAIEELRYYHLGEFNIAGTDLIVSRTGWSSEWGYELYLRDPARGDHLFEHLLAAGEPFGLKLGAVSQIRRIEGGMLSYGADMDLGTNPYEVGLGRLMDLDKPHFIGKEALTHIAAQGPKRMLRGVSFEGGRLAGFIEPWTLRVAGEAVSQVTSLAYSPRLGRNIGLTIVANAHAQADTAVELMTPDGPRQGRITGLPFIGRKTVKR